MTPLMIKIISYFLPALLMVIAIFGIFFYSGIRWKQATDEQGIRHFSYSNNERRFAAFGIITCVFCIMVAGSILTFEISGHPEKSRNLAATILFQNTATAEAGR